MEAVHQGMILKLERPEMDILVLSKDFFNASGLVITCPVLKDAIGDALHIEVTAQGYSGVACLENLKSIDIRKRHYEIKGELSFIQIQNLSDAVQGIFDYYPHSS